MAMMVGARRGSRTRFTTQQKSAQFELRRSNLQKCFSCTSSWIKTIKYSRSLVSSFQIMRIAFFFLVHECSASTPISLTLPRKLLLLLSIVAYMYMSKVWISQTWATQFHPSSYTFKWCECLSNTTRHWRGKEEFRTANSRKFCRMEKSLVTLKTEKIEWVNFDAEKNCRDFELIVVAFNPQQLFVSKNQRWQ